MEKTLIVANWKEHKTNSEARGWVEVLSSKLKVKSEKLEVVVCPSFVLIPDLHSQLSILNFELSLGAQDVSKFEEGQYTGEVSAKMLKDFVSYVIIGHSERRKCFGETDEDVALKIEQCLKHELAPIVCVSKIEQAFADKAIFAYEPLSAVGTGEPDTPENAQKFAEKIKAEVGQDVKVLYGGSVNAKNAKSFVNQPDLSGVLVGQASLDAEEFARICDEIR